MYTIRPAIKTDYEQIAAIACLVRPEPRTAEEILEQDELARQLPGVQSTRLVAVGPDGRIAGHGYAEHVNWDPQERWSVFACSHPDLRNRGVGTAIYEACLQIAREAGATEIQSHARGEDESSLAWAQRRGFTLDHQRTEAVLYLKDWDGAPFAGAVEKVRQSGIELTVLSGNDFPEDLLRQVYDLDCATTPDVPIWQPDSQFPSYETYRADWFGTRNEFRVALAMDSGRVVGLSSLYFPRHPQGGANTGYTAVLREYRGRGIALALKLLTIEEALKRGVPHMRTNNDPQNGPMLAVNVKLGYQFIPGPWRLKKYL